MSQDLKPGDRIRVTSERPIHGYQPGSTGVVRTGPTTDKSGKTYYGVSMDKDASEDATLFLADPDLRWRRCRYLVEHGRRPSSARDDDVTLYGWRYMHDWWACRDHTDRKRLAQRHPVVAAAHRLCHQPDPLQRARGRARLLARQADDAIAAHCGLSVAAVGAYHDLFFNVRDSLDAEVYIINVVIGPKAHTRLCEDDVEILLKLLGYAHGPRMVDDALRYFHNPPALPSNLDGLDASALAERRLLLQVRLLILTMVAPAHALAGRKLPRIPAPTVDGTVPPGCEESADLLAAVFLREQVGALAPAGPLAGLRFDRSALQDAPERLVAGLAPLCG